MVPLLQSSECDVLSGVKHRNFILLKTLGVVVAGSKSGSIWGEDLSVCFLDCFA